MTEITFANTTFAHLALSVSSGETSFELVPGDINYILPYFSTGTWLYLVLCDYLNHSEIVKVTAITADTLTVERGQSGTSARAWYAGTLIMSRPVAQIFDNCMQQGINRSGAFNPNGVIPGLYIGEKFYQTGPAAGQRRWWMYTNDTGLILTGDRWRLIAGSKYGNEWEDDDGFIWYVPNWVERSDPSYWTAVNATWQPAQGYWLTTFNTLGSLTVNGTWAAGKEWPNIRMSIQQYDQLLLDLDVKDTNGDKIDDPAQNAPNYYCDETRTITWGAFDFNKLEWDARATLVTFRVYVNEGSAMADFPPTYTEKTNQTFWTPQVVGCTWNGTGWDYDIGETYGWWLATLGGWETSYRPNTCKLTANKACMKYGSIRSASGMIGEFDAGAGTYETVTFDLCGYANLDILELKINCNPTDGKLIKIEFGEEQF